MVEETGGPRVNYRLVAGHGQTLSDNIVLLSLSGSRTHISRASKWPGTMYKFIIIFQQFYLKKIKFERFFYMKILKIKIPIGQLYFLEDISNFLQEKVAFRKSKDE